MISEKKQMVEVLKIYECASSAYITQERPELNDLPVTWIAKPYAWAVTSSHLMHLPNLRIADYFIVHQHNRYGPV